MDMCLQITIEMDRMDYSSDRSDSSEEEGNKQSTELSKVFVFICISISFMLPDVVFYLRLLFFSLKG